MSQAIAGAPFEYVGGELALFEKARNWKAYWSGQIQEYLRGDILEVGAGIGANTRLLANYTFDRWTCLEPDPALLTQIGILPGHRHEYLAGTVQSLLPDARYNAILYIDVLEHIEDHSLELVDAARHLKPGGVLIVLSPAHPFLFTPFDAAIGHYRRYTRRSLQAVVPGTLKPVRLRYLDSAGMLASAGNRLLLQSAMPTERQILLWDRFLVSASRWIDPALGWTVGKTVLGVWRREAGNAGFPS